MVKNSKKIIFSIFVLLSPAFVLGDEIIKIAETHNPEATALNNGRRIVRTSYDRRLVVYQDSLDNRPVIMWSYSDDGVVWSSPSTLAYGCYPSLTIAENDWIYVCWTMEHEKGIGVNVMKDNTLLWESGNLPLEISPNGALYCKFPVIEITTNSVHIVFQSKVENNNTENILYQRYDRSLSDTTSTIVILSPDSCNSRLPTIAGDLEFNVDLVHIFWTEVSPTYNHSRIMYCKIDETEGINNYAISEPIIMPFMDKKHPSISVRNYNPNGSDIIISYTNNDGIGFFTSILYSDSSGIFISGTDTINTVQNPKPTVDDAFMHSCAVIWQDNNTVYYAQNVDGNFVTLPPIQISGSNQISINPNVCYKTFRYDVFDVIWTEGDRSPYNIMYRRMEKRQSPLSIKNDYNANGFPRSCQLLQNYPNPFNQTTTIRYSLQNPNFVTLTIYDIHGRKIQTLLTEFQRAGDYTVNVPADDLPSGIYVYKLIVGNKLSSSKKMVLIR